MTEFESKVVLSEVFKCIKLASKNSGKVFGGFVRDVIVPRIFDEECKVSFNDVDIWFKTDSDAINFINSMGNKIVRIEAADIMYNGGYPNEGNEFSRRKFKLIKWDTCLTCIDVVTSKLLPVNDFDVNEVTYSYNSSGNLVTLSPNRLIRQIIHKRATMLQTCEVLCTENETTKKYYRERIIRNFISKGWQVYMPRLCVPCVDF
jgi:hypothetical protein